ncbi:hypothetical protein PG995_009342 [Apiospora arundinis]
MGQYATEAQQAAALANGSRWDIGMPLPAGGLFKYSTRGKVVKVGTGQLADPMTIWLCDLPNEGLGPKAAIEDMVQRVAVQVGVTHAWVRSRVHNYGYAYDQYGNRIPIFDEHGKFVEWKFVRKDNHITVAFGTSETHVNVHGHIYVKADATGAPTGFMDLDTRKYVCYEDNRIIELWKQTERRNGPASGGDSARHQDSFDRPRWQEEFLMDHYCPCPHRDGPVLAPLYHGLEHTPAGDDTVTGSGMADAAKNTRAVLVRSSKTKTFLLGY